MVVTAVYRTFSSEHNTGCIVEVGSEMNIFVSEVSYPLSCLLRLKCGRQVMTTMRLHRLVRVVLLTLLLLGAFVVGQRYSGSASAQARQKWEYQVVKADRIERIGAAGLEVKGLSKLGEDGWDAVGINDSWVLLKRSK